MIRMICRSEPDADAKGKAHATGALARLPRKIRRLPESPLIDDADVGREFAIEFVAQPEAGIDVGKPDANQAGRVRLAVDVQLDLRLQDEPLCEQEFVGGLRFGGEDGPRR